MLACPCICTCNTSTWYAIHVLRNTHMLIYMMQYLYGQPILCIIYLIILAPPTRQAVYTALKETETRATDVVPYWKLPGADRVVPRLIKAAAAVQLIRDTTEMLVAKCRVRAQGLQNQPRI